ncbi:MAG TPA: HlyD family efflux transporter periplasmic adaptor subunit [Pirellulales bacterium]|nr:HlyD family efflux transporter periplasmic adaptor subunit [Pirellulales bacterium]
MLTLADSLVSSSARKLAMRKRPDLTARLHRYQGRVYWVVKEPVGLNYFRFQEEEYAILQMLDGFTSLDEIKDAFEAQFPPQKIGIEELQQFIGMLHRSGLIIANVPGQGHQLLERRRERWRKEWLGRLSNVLSVRFKGIDPDRILNWLYPKIKWIYTPAAVAVCCLLALSALSLVLIQFDVFHSKLPTFHQFFTLKNAFVLSIALGVTKVIHEFGHGLTCKHFGGECHEMGVMLLVLTPCLYCNVSDSWMLPNKWHRAAIGAAGMYIEMVIASICTFIWWYTEPGMLNHLCLSTMFVCSVSTLMFNSNPLLRYDGYYILADLIEIPNLRQKATDILNRKMGEICLGLEPPDDPFLPDRNQALFALYSVAAAIYRWVVVFSILFFLYEVWKPYRLEIIGQIIGVAALYGLLVQPFWKLGKFFYVPGRIDKVKKPRMYATLGVIGAVLAAVMLVPLPHRVYCTFEIQPRDAKKVFVTVPGELADVRVKSGDEVDENTVLAKLDNLDVEIDLAKLDGERRQNETQLRSLLRRRHIDREANLEIPAVEATLTAINEQLREKQVDLRRLTLSAPVSGTVLPPPEQKEQKPDRQLASWHGTPLQERNRGAYLQEGTLFCQVGDPRKMEAVLVVDQADIDYVRKNDHVDIKLDEMPLDELRGEVIEIAHEPLRTVPRHLGNKQGGELATKTDESGVERPMNTSYQVRVPIDDSEGLLRLGLKGRARIHTRPQTLGHRLWRFIAQTFNFRL